MLVRPFVQNQIKGPAIHCYRNGDTVRGLCEVQDNQIIFNGPVIYKSANGDLYEGQSVNGRKTGECTLNPLMDKSMWDPMKMVYLRVMEF
jgi:hypothetical protein